MQVSDRQQQQCHTEAIIGAQHFNFANKSAMRRISSSKFCIFGNKILQREEIFSTGYNLWKGAGESLPPATEICWCIVRR